MFKGDKTAWIILLIAAGKSATLTKYMATRYRRRSPARRDKYQYRTTQNHQPDYQNDGAAQISVDNEGSRAISTSNQDCQTGCAQA